MPDSTPPCLRRIVASLVLAAAPFAAHAADLPECADVEVPSPVPSVDASCAAADLVPLATTLCVESCTAPAAGIYVPVANQGTAAAGAFQVQLVRRDGDGDLVVHTETISGLDSGELAVVGPVRLDLAAWSTGSLLAVVDTDSAIDECDESNTGSVGPWPDPVFDADGDGFESESCGGSDCDDSDATIRPGAVDVPDDGIDQDCSGSDASRVCDYDGDGTASPACGGDDCDDADPAVHPGAIDIADDGIDQDCDGVEHCAQDAYIQGGCATGPASGALWLGLLGLLATRRRAS